jgi:hypothetical protein
MRESDCEHQTKLSSFAEPSTQPRDLVGALPVHALAKAAAVTSATSETSWHREWADLMATTIEFGPTPDRALTVPSHGIRHRSDPRVLSLVDGRSAPLPSEPIGPGVCHGPMRVSSTAASQETRPPCAPVQLSAQGTIAPERPRRRCGRSDAPRNPRGASEGVGRVAQVGCRGNRPGRPAAHPQWIADASTRIEHLRQACEARGVGAGRNAARQRRLVASHGGQHP